jgi:hypothetical protein
MQVFETIDTSSFRYNGIKYAKNFMVVPYGTTNLGVYNAFDTSTFLVSSANYSDIQIDGTIYNSLMACIDVLSPLIFYKPSGSGIITDANFVYNQNIPSNTWIITHTLNKLPSVTVTDSAGTVVEGQIDYNSTSQITITFTGAFTGTVILN